MAFVERCGRVWRGHWLLADGCHRGSRSGFATKWEAKHFADAREVAERAAAARRGEPGAAEERAVTVGQWWDRWFRVQDLAPGTLETYAQQFRHHIAPRFAGVPVGQVTGLDLAGFSRDLREQGLSRSSVTVVMSVLRDMLGDAAAEGVIPAAPRMPGRGRTRHAPVSVRPGRVLELETVLRVCARLPGQYALMVVVGAFTGMRWGEVCAMRRAVLHLQQPGAAAGQAWYEIDARTGAVHEDVHAHRYFGPPKGGSGRDVDLPPFLVKLLTRHIQAMNGREMWAGAGHRMTCSTPRRTQAITPTGPPGDKRMQTCCRPCWVSPPRPGSRMSTCGDLLETRRSGDHLGSDQWLTFTMADSSRAGLLPAVSP
jgi:integrase